MSPFHFVCELRKQIHQASPNFSWLLFPPNLWVMAHRQLMFCTWFCLHLWLFLLFFFFFFLNWTDQARSGYFYRALVSPERHGSRDLDVCCLPVSVFLIRRASKQGLCRFVNYLLTETLSSHSHRASGILGNNGFSFSFTVLVGWKMTLSCLSEKNQGWSRWRNAELILFKRHESTVTFNMEQVVVH